MRMVGESKKPASEEQIDCILCEGNDLSPLFRPRRSPGPVVLCRKCGLVFVSPRIHLDHIVSESQFSNVPPEVRLSSNLEALEYRWEKSLIAEYLEEYQQKMANSEQLLREIESFVPTGRMLDFGTGPGLFLSAAKARDWDVYGLEPLIGFAIFARGYFGLDVTNGFLEDDTFPEAHFDVITALQVLEHLIDPVGNLRRLHRCLKPGGLFVVEVPNISSIWVKLLRDRHRHFVEDHLYFYEPATLKLLLERTGFQVVKQGYSKRIISARSCVRQLIRHLSLSPNTPRGLQHLLGRLPFSDASIALNLSDIIYAFAVK